MRIIGLRRNLAAQSRHVGQSAMRLSQNVLKLSRRPTRPTSRRVRLSHKTTLLRVHRSRNHVRQNLRIRLLSVRHPSLKSRRSHLTKSAHLT
jgi:hypothetical protein